MATEGISDSTSGPNAISGQHKLNEEGQDGIMHSPLPPQAQTQTHSLDIQGKALQQQQQQLQQDNGPSSNDAVSPQELTLYVESLLQQLNTKFDGVSTQIFSRMDEMSSRIEELEKSIGELVQNADDEQKDSSPSKPAQE
ncbi:hypothetical protein BX616_001955 [Lobosporangium transversale]|uniref:Heat shock factor binding protein 1-domain-containing protein n=1 Tax=Lobosporangium transversale TaxID=64571 RepID=A0A1Y2GBA5_9FUNG|nr:heat shock factor binding protein 1-domain-containing protein [Lobosporangium transversale]KAF9917095.1 hypothetical protein BX616_001955 [Lobosporangium transversale]ORZ06148.1 heat shock factor binding protein 1-domain-containing protein [Lobosporangium transversale]|eukprot:XP_021877417.1 heat shock factor binding protein 1-domain-containing protein [Lobosporangium transversale]